MDDGANDSRNTYDHHMPTQEEWRREPWFSGVYMLRDQAKSVLQTGKKASAVHPSDSSYKHRLPKQAAVELSKESAVEEFDTERFNCSGSESMHSTDPFKPISIQNLSRPPMVRSYGSSSASSASTLMTPRDAHSWASSAHSPSYIETIDSIPTSSPYQLHILQPAKLAKDISIGDFPTSRDFRFPSYAASISPEAPELDWSLEDHTEAMTWPLCSYQEHAEPKQSKKTRTLECSQRDAKQAQKAHRGTILPGLGIISLDGSYEDGIKLLSKSKSRHGPLTPEQRHNAALMRRRGACRDCRKRKIKCNIRHRSASTESLSSTPPPQKLSISIYTVFSAVLVLRRCLERRYVKLMILPDIYDIPISEQINRQANCFENMTLQGLDLQSLLVRSQMTTESSETNSINSFEDDITEYSHGDSSSCCKGQAQDAGSEELLLAIQPFLDQLPNEIALSLSNELLSLFGIWLGNRPAYRQVPCEGTPSSSNSRNPSDNTATPTNSTSSVPKRLSDDGSGYSDPSGNDGDGKRKRPRIVSQTPSGSTRRWACPYYQRDPHFYCVAGDFGDYRKCSRSPGFGEVHRVKQHLYNCHVAIYCTRCYKRKEDLVDHRRSAVSCDVRDPQPLQGLNEDQRELLKPRDRNRSEEERWKTVYKICFPMDQIIPSPYYVHYTQETAVLRQEILRIVEEETMYVDGLIRERLLMRLQSAFSSNAQNPLATQSPIWSPHALDVSGSDGTYMPSSAAPPMGNPPPWSEWETRHSNIVNTSQIGSIAHHSLIRNDDSHFTGPNMEPELFFSDLPSFDYVFAGSDGFGRSASHAGE